jgi:membrane protein implicated in regulation of membrane protease activity
VARQYAGILGLLALMVSLMRGIIAGGASEATLWAAWLSLLAFTITGAVIGWLAERTIRESVSSRILSDLQENKPAERLASPQAAAAKG